jgi:Protein of unknown function (DUF4197)
MVNIHIFALVLALLLNSIQKIKIMKKVLSVSVVILLTTIFNVSAQSWKDIKKVAEDNSGLAAGLTDGEIGSGLKAALNQGVKKGVNQLNKKDGYLKDPQIKIPMPNEAKSVESKLRSLGQGKKVDDAIESMNRAAEDAAEGAKDIFVAAIKGMTVTDATSILKGDNDAATKYLHKATNNELTQKFRPVIKKSLDKVGATKHWNTVFGSYNKLPFVKKVNPNLEEYVTNKALMGLFIQVAKEELKIRQDPLSRGTDLLKKVFGN